MISDRFPARPIHFTKCHHRETIKKRPVLSARSFFSEIIYHFSQGHTGTPCPAVLPARCGPDFRASSFMNRGAPPLSPVHACWIVLAVIPHLSPASAAVITFSRSLFTVLSLLLRTIKKNCQSDKDWQFFSCRYGDPREIRTPDTLIRSQVLYPAELLGQMSTWLYYHRKCIKARDKGELLFIPL